MNVVSAFTVLPNRLFTSRLARSVRLCGTDNFMCPTTILRAYGWSFTISISSPGKNCVTVDTGEPLKSICQELLNLPDFDGLISERYCCAYCAISFTRLYS